MVELVLIYSAAAIVVACQDTLVSIVSSVTVVKITLVSMVVNVSIRMATAFVSVLRDTVACDVNLLLVAAVLPILVSTELPVWRVRTGIIQYV